MHAFAIARISGMALKQHYKQDLIVEVITFASGSAEKYAWVFCFSSKIKGIIFFWKFFFQKYWNSIICWGASSDFWKVEMLSLNLSAPFSPSVLLYSVWKTPDSARKVCPFRFCFGRFLSVFLLPCFLLGCSLCWAQQKRSVWRNLAL